MTPERIRIAARAPDAPASTVDVDMLHLVMNIRGATDTCRRMMRDLDRGIGSRSVTIMILARESNRLAKLTKILHDNDPGDVPAARLDSILEPTPPKKADT